MHLPTRKRLSGCNNHNQNNSEQTLKQKRHHKKSFSLKRLSVD